MAIVDASIPLQVQQFKPTSPIEQAQQMFSLRAMKDEQDQRQAAMQQQFALKDLFAKSDMSTPEGQQDALRKAYAIDPKTGMALQKQFGEQQKTQAETAKYKAQTDVAQLDSAHKRVEAISGALSSVDQQYQSLIQKGMTPDQAAQQIQPMYQQAVQGLRQGGFIDANHQVPEQFNAQQVKMGIQASMTAQQQLEMKLKAQKEANEERRVGAAERNAAANEKRADAMERKIAQESEGFGGDRSKLLAALAVRNVSLPAGLRSKQQQISTLNGLLERYPELTPDEIAEKVKSGKISLGAEMKETQTAAGISGRVTTSEKELELMAPLLREASADVPRKSFVPVNKLMQMGEANMSDPKLKVLKGRIQMMNNAIDVLGSRGGINKEKQEKLHEQLMASDSHETLMAAVKNIEAEMNIAKKASTWAMAPRSERDKEQSAKTTSSQSSGTPQAPRMSQVIDGYRFMGGDPAKKENWEKVQ